MSNVAEEFNSSTKDVALSAALFLHHLTLLLLYDLQVGPMTMTGKTGSRFNWRICAPYGIYLLFIGVNIASCLAKQGGKIMACYFVGHNFQNLSGDAIDPHLCTHIICTNGIVTPDGVKYRFPTDMEMYKAASTVKLKNPDLKVLISFERGFQTVVDQPLDSVIEKFSQKAVTFLKKLNMDGIDLDWEFPEAYEKIAYIKFIKILSSYLHSSNMSLSMALPAAPFFFDNGFDVATINRYVDFVTVMNYDYHVYNKETDNVTGYNSPLYTPKGEAHYLSTADTLTYFLHKGMSKDKMLMGIPTYGESWTLANPYVHGLHSPAIGLGAAAPYSLRVGSYLYPDVCVAQKQGATTVKDEVNVGEYLYFGSTWVAFDSTFTISKKIHWLKEKDLAGVGIFAYQLDDIYDRCGYGPLPLLRYMKAQLQQNTFQFGTIP